MQKKTIMRFISAMCLMFLILPVLEVYGGTNQWSTTGPYGIKITGLSIHPDNPQIVFATTPDGNTPVYKSTDGGTTWTPSSAGLPISYGEIFSIVFDPDNANILYLPYLAGVYRSTNGGQSWVLKSTAIIDDAPYNIRPWSLDISPLDGTLYAGCYGAWVGLHGGVFRSKDGGESWVQVADDTETDGIISALAVAPSAPYIIYAGGYSLGGIFKSSDGGDTWTNISNGFGTPPSVHSITVDPYDSNVVYMGTARDGIYKTVNGGQSWSPIGNGMGSSDIRDIVIDPGNQQVLYAGGGPNPGTGIPGVYTSLDNAGLSWAPMMDGMGSRAIYSLAIDQKNPQNIYAGTSSGVWKYTVVSGPSDYSVSINNGALFTNSTSVTLSLTAPAGTTEMIVSNDGGFSGALWEPFTSNKAWTITAYGENIIPRIVYVKFRTNGVISGLYQDDILIDTVAPTGSVEIVEDSGGNLQSVPKIRIEYPNIVYLPILMKDALPGFTPIPLTLSASDDFSGVNRMLISHSPSFEDEVWIDFKPSTIYWAPIGETSTVYVRFRDRAGNTSKTYSDSLSY